MSKVLKNRKRNAISLEVKLKILECLAKGEGPTIVGHKFGYNESTIRTIKKNEDAIRKSITYSSKLSPESSYHIRNKLLLKTEKYLILWMNDMFQKGVPVDANVVKQKALQIYNLLQISESSADLDDRRKEFSASDGWLTGFLRRNGCNNLKIKTEPEDEPSEINIDFVDMSNIVTNDNADQNRFIKDQVNQEKCQFNTSLISDGLKLAKCMVDHFLKFDPNKERALQFQRDIKGCLAGYRELYRELKRQ